MRQKHQGVDAGIQKFFDLLELFFVVAIGGAGDGLSSELAGAGFKFVPGRFASARRRWLRWRIRS